MEYDSIAKIKRQFHRLVGSPSDDQALVEHGEAVDEVVELALTRGVRNAQRWMLKNGYGGWRTRSAALSFSGADTTDGGRYTSLPVDFLKAYGSRKPGRSALVQANGNRWGQEIDDDQDNLTGDLYYIRGDELWIARRATLPVGDLFLDYHYTHPPFDSDLDDGDIDFPLEARALIPAEAAYFAMTESWLPGAQDYELKITGARNMAREEARLVSRTTKQPRTMGKPYRVGNRW